MGHNLDAYIKFVAAHNLPDERRYPGIKDMTDEQKRWFMMMHYVTHFAKTTGKIANAFEVADHGGEFKTDFLKIDVAKQLINTLYMASALGMTEEDLLHVIETKYNEKIDQYDS
jgi:hypothetical protein